MLALKRNPDELVVVTDTFENAEPAVIKLVRVIDRNRAEIRVTPGDLIRGWSHQGRTGNNNAVECEHVIARGVPLSLLTWSGQWFQVWLSKTNRFGAATLAFDADASISFARQGVPA